MALDLLFRLKSLLYKRRMARDLQEELAFHQEMAQEKLGMKPGSARQIPDAQPQPVRARFWQFSVFENLLRDLTFSARLLRRSPGFTAVAVLTLALGVGANTAVFSVINALLLRPLPVPHADELAVIGFYESDDAMTNHGFCAPLFRSLENRHEIFQDVAAEGEHAFQVRGASGNQQVRGVTVSGQFFHAMQIRPLLGRYLSPQDDQPGGGSTGFGVVISEGFWRSWFNSAPDVIGRKIILDNAPFVVVGVIPKTFMGIDPTEHPEIYAPLWAEPILDAPYNNIAGGYGSWWLRIMARRKSGVSLEQANAALQSASTAVIDEATDAEWAKGARSNHFRFAAEPGSRGESYFSSLFRKPLLAIFSLCGLMLLLACLNLASLLMARAAARERELATRLAIGASRKRLIQQFLAESFLIAALGTAAGLAAAPMVSEALVRLLFGHLHDLYGMTLNTALDYRVLLFVALTAIVSVFLIGLIPALRATSKNLSDQIKDGSHSTNAREKQRMAPRILMGMEVALALILVSGAGLLAASVTRLYRAGLGFDPKNVVNVGLSMDKQSLDGDALFRWYQAFAEAIQHQPGVKSVSYDMVTPLSGSSWTDDYQTPLSNGPRELYMNEAAPDYFQTMRIPMLTGRDFRWGDGLTSGRKIILNQAAAKMLFPGQDAVGQMVNDVGRKKPYEVIAVVGDVRYRSIRKDDPPGGYAAITQDESKKPSFTAVVRLDGPVAPFAAAVRRLAAQMAPDIPSPILTTMSSELDSSISSERMMAMLSVFFAGCALLVTAIGLYGTLSYATARRTSEIGIRIALGAQRSQVVRLIFRENAWIAAGGALAGLVAALLALRALASFLYGVSAHDPWVMMGSILILEVVASAASLIPAIRASRIEPMSAIRCE